MVTRAGGNFQVQCGYVGPGREGITLVNGQTQTDGMNAWFIPSQLFVMIAAAVED